MVAPRTIAPERLLRIHHANVKTALDDLYEPLPVDPDQWTRTACGDLQRRLYAALAQVEQLAISIDQVTACRESAVRGVTTTSGGMDRWNDFCLNEYHQLSFQFH